MIENNIFNNKVRGFEFISNLPDGIKENCQIPKRSTLYSAGYDFVCPCDVELAPDEQEIIWTGIKAYMRPNEVLLLDVRSSIGIKKHLMLANTIGVIDSDYYNNPQNEGEIGICLKNCGKENITIKTGEKIAQGIFVNYLLADNDEITEQRQGGIGSTDGK